MQIHQELLSKMSKSVVLIRPGSHGSWYFCNPGTEEGDNLTSLFVKWFVVRGFLVGRQREGQTQFMFCISGSGSVNDNIMIITPGGGQKSGQSILRTAITELGRKAPWCKRQPCHSNIQHLASPRHRDDRCCFNQLENQHQNHVKHRQHQQKKLVDCPTQLTCFVHFDLCICQCFITNPK